MAYDGRKVCKHYIKNKKGQETRIYGNFSVTGMGLSGYGCDARRAGWTVQGLQAESVMCFGISDAFSVG